MNTVQSGGSPGKVVIETTVLFIANSLSWLGLSLSDTNSIIVIIFTAISALFLLYRFRIQYLKDIRAGLFAFKWGKKALGSVTRKTTIADLAAILSEAEESGNHAYAKQALEAYFKIHNAEYLQNGQQKQEQDAN